MQPHEERLLDEFFDAWVDDQAARMTSEKTEEVEGPSAPPDERDLAALFEQAARCADALKHGWPHTGRGSRAEGPAPESLAASEPSAGPQPSTLNPQPSTFGRFEIVRLLGRGGMGSVFLALDPELGRPVALKIPHDVDGVGSELRERFLREARAAGALKHPGLVPVFETGRDGEVSYIVSEFCDGPSLAEWLAQRDAPVPVKMAARIVAELAEAVQHAHERGILHRDLKPGNVLLDAIGDSAAGDNAARTDEQRRGGRRSDSDARRETRTVALPFRPRVTDFGLAQLVEQESSRQPVSRRGAGASQSQSHEALATLTRFGAVVGTAAYMAPEQADGRRELVGPHTDVYALGAMLYELLAGEPPFGSGGPAETAATKKVSCVKPRRRRGDVPRDLEAICLQCLETEPERRYVSAALLQADLERFLRGEPTLARPLSQVGRVWRWSRRHPAVAAMIVLVIAAAAGLVAGLSIHTSRLAEALAATRKERSKARQALAQAEHEAQRAEQERRRAEEERRRAEEERRRAEEGERQARELLHTADMAQAIRAWRDGDLNTVSELLARHVPRDPSDDLRGFEWHLLEASLREQAEREFRHGAAVRHCAVTPDGKRLITAGDDALIRVWEIETGEPIATLARHLKVVREVAVSPDGRLLASGGDDDFVMLWDLETLEFVRVLGKHPTGIETVCWSPDGKLIASGARYSDVRLWSPDGELVFTIEDDGRHESLVFSPDSRLLYLPQKYRLAVWDLERREKVATRDPHGGAGPRAMCALAGGSLLATSDMHTPEIALLNATEFEFIAKLTGDCDYSSGFTVSPDGRWLASAGTDGQVRVYDVAGLGSRPADQTRSRPPEQRGVAIASFVHEGPTTAVLFVDARRLATTGEDGFVRIWDLEKLGAWRRVGPSWGALNPSADGNSFLFAGRTGDDALAFWRPSSAAGADGIDNPPQGVEWFVAEAHSRDRRWIARSSGGTVQLWDVERRRTHGQLTLDGRIVHRLGFSADGEHLAFFSGAGEDDHAAHICNVRSRELSRRLDLHAGCSDVCFSPDGQVLAVARDEGFLVWDWAADEIAFRVDAVAWGADALAWDAAGDCLAVSGDDDVIRLWDARTWQPLRQFTDRALDGVRCVSFAPDGRTLLAGGTDGTIRGWHMATGRPLGALYRTPHPQESIKDILVSPDGRWLAAATESHGLPGILVSRAFGEMASPE
ncbi:MAG: protein kinase [Planctomycetes bacterium]|nr:protein kinase [Planctomycetota bacterium]